MDIDKIRRNIDEFLSEFSPEEIEAMREKAKEKYPDGITLEEYLDGFADCYPYLTED